MAALAIAVFTFCVYTPAVHYGFIGYDDQDVRDNKIIKSFDLPLIVWAFTSFTDGNWIPATWISFAADYYFWGSDPSGHHLHNIILHSLNVFLVALLIFRVVSLYMEIHGISNSQETDSFALPVAAFTALIFGVHPLRVESVVWIFERKDVLYAFFYLVSLLFYLSYKSQTTAKKANTYYLGSLFAFALSLISKPMAVTLPVILLLLDTVCVKKTDRSFFHLINYRDKIPFFLFSFAVSIISVVGQKSINCLLPISDYSVLARFLNSTYSIWFYVYKSIIPTNLSPFYPLHAYDASTWFYAMLPLTFFMVISAFCTAAYLRGRDLFAAVWSYYIVSLLPVMGIIKVGNVGVADRFAYMPTLSIILILSIGLVKAITKVSALAGHSSNNIRNACIAIIISLSLGLSVITERQVLIWHDPLSLWQKAVEIVPEGSSVPYLYRGFAWIDNGDLDKAFLDCNKALTIEPACEKCMMCRAEIFEKGGNDSAALSQYDAIIARNPLNADAINNRGFLHLRLGNEFAAQADFRLRDQLEKRPAGQF